MKDNIVQISATDFKKHLLNLVDQVKDKHNSFIITKRKLPIAKVVPLEATNKKNLKSYFGFLKGSIKINDNIVSYSSETDWEANND